MNRERLIRLGAVLILLVAGWLIGQYHVAPTQNLETGPPDGDFRAWFWEHREVDLIVQVGLLFLGALSITALLPESDEAPPP